MFFNGFTLLLMIISAIGGFAFGMRVEEQHQRRLAKQHVYGETIQEQMKRDGWTL
jgi:hypothetical protein